MVRSWIVHLPDKRSPPQPVRLARDPVGAAGAIDPDPYPITKPPQFFESATGTFTLAGELASALLRGGAYIRFPGSAAEASQLASAGLADLVGDRYEQFRVFQSEAPWTPWFFDIAWEHTWILADYERLEVSVLCKTDTD
jgi:hypothetical protein